MAEADALAADNGGSGECVLTLRLYVAGDSPNSIEARANLTALLEGRPPDMYHLEVVDFMREPQRALRDGVIVTPTLVKLTPLPLQRIIGTLRERLKVLAALGIPTADRV